MMSSKGPRSRADYLLQRKHPQIAWMVQRIRQLLAQNDNHQHHQHHHIVDVGGGRGDLTVALAQVLFSEHATTTARSTTIQITLVDCNASSLRAAQEHAAATVPQQQNNCNSIHFVRADFAEYCRDVEERHTTPPPTVVVALHACGDLSDAALQFAVRHRCSFCICPCCYTKRNCNLSTTTSFVPPYILEHQAILDEAAAAGKSKSRGNTTTTNRTTTSTTTTKTTTADDARDSALAILGRLAETDERPDLLRRAAIVFNSMRIKCIPRDDFDVRLEEYDPLTSNRNLVLVGTPKQQKQ